MPLHSPEDRRQRVRDDLALIRSCLDRGETVGARERLCALPMIASADDDSAVEIGQLFHDLGFPEMAGRYWYFVEERTGGMEAAVRRFEESCGGNPRVIGNALGMWGTLPVPDHGRMQELEQAEREWEERFDYGWEATSRWWKDRLVSLGCGAIAFAVLFVFVMGIVFIGILIFGEL